MRLKLRDLMRIAPGKGECTETLSVLVTWSGHQPPTKNTELRCDYFGEHELHAGFLEGVCISWAKG